MTTIAEARADVSNAQADVDVARADLDKALSRLESGIIALRWATDIEVMEKEETLNANLSRR